MQGRTEGRLSTQDSASVICSRCHQRIDLSQPLPREGWQVVHSCLHTVEAMAIKAGERPWAWRASEAKAG